MQLLIFVPVILIALAESWLQPWFSVAGVSLPLTLITLSILSIKMNTGHLPWLGLLAGLVIDIGSANYIGANAAYYLFVGWIATQNFSKMAIYKRAWIRAGLFISAAFIQPWYLLIINRQLSIDVDYNLWISAIRAGWVAIVAITLVWVLTRKDINRI